MNKIYVICSSDYDCFYLHDAYKSREKAIEKIIEKVKNYKKDYVSADYYCTYENNDYDKNLYNIYRYKTHKFNDGLYDKIYISSYEIREVVLYE